MKGGKRKRGGKLLIISSSLDRALFYVVTEGVDSRGEGRRKKGGRRETVAAFFHLFAYVRRGRKDREEKKKGELDSW